MKEKKRIAVIGLGGFGKAVSQELIRLGHQVLGIDRDEQRANQMADCLSQTVIADGANETAMAELALQDFDAVLVAIGEDIQASILCTMVVKSLEASPVWVKAITPMHRKILEKLGADRIFDPEYEMGLRVAQSMLHTNMLDYISLGDDYFVVELRPGESLENQTVADLKLEKRKVTLLAIKHGQEIMQPPSPDHVLRRNDHLLLLGSQDALRRAVEAL